MPANDPPRKPFHSSSGSGGAIVTRAIRSSTRAEASTVRRGPVAASGWQWDLGEPLLPGSSSDVLGTHDGGFIASIIEDDSEFRAELLRGYRDGMIERWQLPDSVRDLGIPILEPQGTILIPNGDTFVRVAPFAARSNGWDGEPRVDQATGTAEAVGLNNYLSGRYASASEGAGETRTVRLVAQQGDISTVGVTTEGFLDDSVFGVRMIVHLRSTDEGLLVDHIEWASTCQPGRGHQDDQPALCT